MLELYEKLKSSAAYKEHMQERAYLSHIFIMLPNDFNPDKDFVENYEIQFGFYNKDLQQILTFMYHDGDFFYGSEDKPFGENEIEEIDLSEAKVEPHDCFVKLGALIKEKYRGNIPLKTIVILQKLKEGFVWNITVLRSDFKTLNVKIDAITGEVVSDSLKGLIEVDK